MRLGILLLAITLWEAWTDENLRIWRDRGKVAVLVALGLWLAGADVWRALAAGIAAGALCIAPGAWLAVAPVAGGIALAGFCCWALGVQL